MLHHNKNSSELWGASKFLCQHWKRAMSTNMLKHIEIKRRGKKEVKREDKHCDKHNTTNCFI